MKLPHQCFDEFIQSTIRDREYDFGKIIEIVPLTCGQEFAIDEEGLLHFSPEDYCLFKFLDSKTIEGKCCSYDGTVVSTFQKKKYFFEVYDISNGKSITLKFKFSSKNPNVITIFAVEMENLFPEFEEILSASFPMREGLGEYITMKMKMTGKECAYFDFIEAGKTGKLGDYTTEERELSKYLKRVYSSPRTRAKVEEIIILQPEGEMNLGEFKRVIS